MISTPGGPMDPNECLRKIRISCDALEADLKKYLIATNPEWDDIAPLIRNIRMLDAWMTGGGYNPADWKSGARR